MHAGFRVMGNGSANYQLPITHYPLPITHYRLPTPDSQFPTPDSQGVRVHA